MTAQEKFLADFRMLLEKHEATMWTTMDGEIRISLPPSIDGDPMQVVYLPASCNFDNI